ncbi:peroxynitrite isomerase THAP4 [Rhipicephalus sanguineus]|uniref:peroxynitrite isomerase THAP4 n=1 Tax=Rhipicephalus sanguineus TaxID=34632 RepID=UPI0020C27E23|nr:peroxynitrite isomerase THAP4 [Rhipicephalus sanguineus]
MEKNGLRAKSNRMCSVPQCTNRAIFGKVSLHRFPKEKKRRKLWTIKLRIGKQVSKEMVVCSEHFNKDDFFWGHLDELKPLRRRLKRNAVPSQNIPLRSHEAEVRPRICRRKHTADTQGNKGQDTAVPPEAVTDGDCACELPNYPEEGEYDGENHVCATLAPYF